MHDDSDHAGHFPDAEESRLRLRGARWTIGCKEFRGTNGPVWIVSGYNGENLVCVAASTRGEAWWRACQQAEAVGMLGRPILPSAHGRPDRCRHAGGSERPAGHG